MVYQDAIASSIRRHLSNLKNPCFKNIQVLHSVLSVWPAYVQLYSSAKYAAAQPACTSSSRQQLRSSIVARTMCVYVKVLFFRVKRTTNEVKAMVIKRPYYITSQARQD